MWRFRRVATRLLNPVLRPLAGWLPAFGIITHVGRSSGRTYRTPVNVFRRGDAYLFFTTYGSDVDWVQNVLAAGTCSLRTLGRDVVLIEPELVSDPELQLAPPFVRFVERHLAGATDMLRMRAAPSTA
jgi:deazaflavin-dependent oxidoreductase (nitroreductase family)